MLHNIGNWLAIRAFMTPDKQAYVDTHRTPSLTFAELNARSNQIANALVDRGVRKGERIALLLMNSPEFMELFFALGKIGAMVVPLNWRLVADELEFMLDDSGATTLVFGDEFIPVVEELFDRRDKHTVTHWLQVVEESTRLTFAKDYTSFRDQGSNAEPQLEVGDDDELYIMYTSGTTGLPKGVVHTHRTSAWGALTIAASTYYHENDRFISPLPMFHVGALTPLTVNVYRGVTSIVMRSFDPVEAWRIIDREQVTTGLFVPAMLNFMLQVPNFDQFDFDQWRWCWSGAAPVPVSLIQAFVDLGIEVHQIYGLTESCGPACLTDSKTSLSHIGSTGKAFYHTCVKIVRPDGSECDPGEPGEILVHGEHIMKEYWNQPEATAETIIDGWLHTGDVARMDAEGFVYIEDRIKDMIISGGENVYPAEIEKVLDEHEELRESAVIGQPSEKWGESPFVIAVRNNDAMDENRVLGFLNGRLARYKMPVGVAFVDAIPRNPSGKILKRILREQFPGPAPI